jgi:hypothetical protein
VDHHNANAYKNDPLYSSTLADTKGTPVTSYNIFDALDVVQPSPSHFSPAEIMAVGSAGVPKLTTASTLNKKEDHVADHDGSVVSLNFLSNSDILCSTPRTPTRTITVNRRRRKK